MAVICVESNILSVHESESRNDATQARARSYRIFERRRERRGGRRQRRRWCAEKPPASFIAREELEERCARRGGRARLVHARARQLIQQLGDAALILTGGCESERPVTNRARGVRFLRTDQQNRATRGDILRKAAW